MGGKMFPNVVEQPPSRLGSLIIARQSCDEAIKAARALAGAAEDDEAVKLANQAGGLLERARAALEPKPELDAQGRNIHDCAHPTEIARVGAIMKREFPPGSHGVPVDSEGRPLALEHARRLKRPLSPRSADFSTPAGLAYRGLTAIRGGK